MIASTETSKPLVDTIAAAWSTRAHELAAWGMRQVNRTDCYGAYYVRGESIERTVRPTKADDRKPGTLKAHVLRSHFMFPQAEHRVGLFTTNPPGENSANPESNHCRWGAIDIDCHGDSVDATSTLDCALRIYGTLSGMGFNVLLTTSDGRGGYHIRILFNEPTPSKPLFYFLKSLVKGYASFGLTEEPETFPKQAALSNGAYGNWLRMIGKHHKHDHYSTVYNSERWLSGHAAIDYILAMEFNSPSLVPSLKETKPTSTTSKKKAKPTTSHDRLKIVESMRFLDSSRADNYDTWLHIGMAIHRVFGGNQSGLDLWDDWSRKSEKYVEGETASKWSTFKPDGENRIGLGRIIEWAKEDSKGELLKQLEKLEGYVRNFYEEIQPASSDKSGSEEKTEVFPLTIPCIIDRIQEATNGWPRRIGTNLFIHERPARDVYWIKDSASLFGYLNTRTGSVRWERDKDSKGFATKEEVFAELRRTAKQYDAIEAYPHCPPIEGRYYAHDEIKPGDGTKLRQLISMFSPLTQTDYDLILTAFLSAVWGGRPGAIPCFFLTSPDGRGVGKTTLVELLALLLGGYIAVSANEDITKLKERLLSPDALTKRIALIDNMKSLKFSWGELEALITSRTISGRRMYVGEFQRPNNVVWFITVNGASLSEDMAQRAVVIKLARQEYRPGWQNDVSQFIEANRHEIIGDAIGILSTEQTQLRRFSRWEAWEREVLSCVTDPGEAQKVIAERQAETNVDNEEAEIIEEHFAERLAELNYDPEIAVVRIPRSIACEWYLKATNEKGISNTKITRVIKQLIEEKTIKRIQEDSSRNYGRCWIWYGTASDPASKISNDIESRIDHLQRKNGGAF